MRAARAINDGCWSWLEEHRDFFRISRDVQYSLGACGVLAWVLSALPVTSRDKRAQTLATQVLDEFNSFDLVALATRDPDTLNLLALAALLAEWYGTGNASWTNALAIAVARGTFHTSRRNMHRRLELMFLLQSTGHLVSGGFRHLFESTVVGSRLLLSRYTIEDFYALAHVVSYVTAYGDRCGSAMIGAAQLDHLRWKVNLSSALALADGHIDLLGELLASRFYLNSVDPAFSAMSIRFAKEQQRSDGAFALALTGNSVSVFHDLEFADLYHSTLVWMLTSSLFLA